MLTITSLINPIYANADGTQIDCQVTFEELPNEVLPFSATAWDIEPHGTKIYKDLIDNKYGIIAPFIPPPPKVQPVTTGMQTI